MTTKVTDRYASDGLELHVGELFRQFLGLDVFENQRNFPLSLCLVPHRHLVHPVIRRPTHRTDR